MQNKNTIKNWKIEITEEGAKLFITEGYEKNSYQKARYKRAFC